MQFRVALLQIIPLFANSASFANPLIRLSGYPVIRSSGHPDILEFGHAVIRGAESR
jgi:hypothetical protein